MKRRRARELAADLHRAVARRQFRAAALAGTIPGHLRRRRVAVKRAVLAHRRLHPADRTAIDARRPHRDKEAAIKARIARKERLVALVGSQVHADNIYRDDEPCSPFSDIEFSNSWRDGLLPVRE